MKTSLAFISTFICPITASLLSLQPCALAQGEDCVTAPSGLVGWWRGEGNALDQAGTNNGTVTGNVSYAPGQVQQAFVFDGIHRDRVDVGNPASLQLQDFTIQAWIKRSSATDISLDDNGEDGSVAGQGGLVFSYGRNGYGFALLDDGRLVLTKVDVDGVFSSSVVSDTNWHHVAVTKSGAAAVFYVDGVADPVPQAYNTLYQFSTSAAIGSRGDARGGTFFGMIDEPTVYGRALSASEIQAIHNAGSSGKCPPPSSLNGGLVAYYPFSGNANDVTGNGNDGTVSGATLTTDRFGNADSAYSFQGTPQSKITINHTNLLLQPPFSCSVWVNWTGGTENPRFFTDQAWEIGLFWPGVTRPIDFNNATTSGLFYCLSDGTFPQGSWHQVVAVRSASEIKLYVDGLLQSVSNVTDSLVYAAGFGTTWLPTIGGSTGIGYPYDSFAGSIDDVRIYNRALSDEDVTKLYGLESQLPTTNCAPAPSGLAGWWKGEGNALDSAGRNNGLVSGNLSFAAGEAGQAFVFNDGTADVRIPASSNINVGTGNGFTLETWIDPANLDPQPVMEWNSGTGYDDIGAHLWISGGPSGPGDAGNLYANVRDIRGGSHFIWSAGGVVSSNTFQHVALTYDKTTGMAVIYRNGFAIQTQNLGRFTPHTRYDLHLGRRAGGYYSGAYYLGEIDEASLYKRALSAPEVAAIYQAGSAGKCPAAGQGFLLDIDIQGVYGVTSNASVKVGFAAIGQTANDYWNFYTRDDANAPGGARSSGAVSNLLLVDRTLTQIGMTVDNGPGAWSSDSSDPMYVGYIYPFSGNLTITLTNLPAGQYEVLPYSRDGSIEVTVGGVSYGIKQAEDLATAGLPTWTEGVQYVRFRNVIVNAGQALVLTVRPGLAGYATLSGLQIMQVGPVTATPPSIISQPTDQIVAAGGTASFSVSAQGTPSPSYQWFFGSNPLNGQVGSSLTLFKVRPDQAGNYSVIVSNAYGSVISSNAALRVNHPPVADASATALLVIACDKTDVAVVLNGTRSSDPDGDPLQYLWFESGMTAPLATGVVAVVTLPIGTNSIVLTVDDGFALNRQTIEVDVITTSQAVEQLLRQVNASVFRPRPFVAILTAALASIDRGNTWAAAHQLSAFQSLVRDRIRRVDPVLAQKLHSASQTILESLDCGSIDRGHRHEGFNARIHHRQGHAHLEFPGQAGRIYVVESSTDLVHWEKIGVATNRNDGNFDFDDTARAPLPMRFYRVVAP